MSKNNIGSFQNSYGGPMAAEFFGTTMLTLAVLSSVGGFLSKIDGALVAGLTLGIIVLLIGRASGAHVNPAVSIGMFVVGKLKLDILASYIVAQVAGAFAALGIWNFLVGQDIVLPARRLSEDIDFFAAEAVGALIFGYGVAATIYYKDKLGNTAAMAGGALFVGASAASMGGYGILNPAIAAAMDQLNWMHIAGPVIGFAAGVFACKFVHRLTSE